VAEKLLFLSLFCIPPTALELEDAIAWPSLESETPDRTRACTCAHPLPEPEMDIVRGVDGPRQGTDDDWDNGDGEGGKCIIVPGDTGVLGGTLNWPEAESMVGTMGEDDPPPIGGTLISSA
jgi:hypothetical protein